MAFADTANLAVKLSLEGNFSSQIGHAESSLSHFNSTVGKTVSKVGTDLGRGIRTAGQNIERLAFVAGGLAIGAGAAVTKWAGDFQAQLNTINTIAFATPEALDAIGNGIRDIAKKTGLATDDLTGAYYDLLSAGVRAADAQSLLNDAVTLGIGGLATTTQTVDLLTTAYNAYHLTAAQSAVATDQFAQAVADGKVKADEIAASFSNVASIAATYKVGIDQIATAYATLTAQGVPAAEVTVEMQRAIISLIKPLPTLMAAQKALKINFTEEIQKKGLVPALQELRLYADKNKIPLIELLGRVEAVKFALQTTGPNFQGYLTEQQRILDSGGEAAKQAAERQKGFNFELARLKANVKDAGITIGSSLLPPLADLAHELTDFLTGHQQEIKDFGVNLGNGIRDAVRWAKSLDWNSIGTGLKTAAFFAKVLIDGFMNLPPGVKETLAGLYALNKLSGGAVVNIGVDITKGLAGGLFQQFLGRGSPANPMFVVPVGSLAGGLSGAAGGLSLATVGKVAAAGALTGLTVAAVVETQQAISNSTSEYAKGIHENLNTSLASGPSDADLRTKLAAIDSGIRQITSNPLLVLVQGSALDELRAMREDVAKQLAGQGKRADDLVLALPKGAAKQDDIRESNRIAKQTGTQTASKIDYAKIATTRKIDDTTNAVQTSQTAIVAAIQALAAAFHISISISDITKAQNTQGGYRQPTVLNRPVPV